MNINDAVFTKAINLIFDTDDVKLVSYKKREAEENKPIGPFLIKDKETGKESLVLININNEKQEEKYAGRKIRCVTVQIDKDDNVNIKKVEFKDLDENKEKHIIGLIETEEGTTSIKVKLSEIPPNCYSKIVKEN